MLGDHLIKFARKDEKPSKLEASPKMQVFEAARLLLSKHADKVSIEGEELSVDLDTIIRQVQNTPELAKRAAKTFMSSAPRVSESNISNAHNIAARNNLEVLPVVNDSGKLTGTWFSGKVTKKPLVVRLGTRAKLVVEKVLIHPVVVIDKHRNPRGVVTKRDLLELAASYQEYSIPIFYSGVEDLNGSETIKEMAESYIQKVNRHASVTYSSVHIAKRGVWVSNVKVSTPLRTFITSSESKEPGLSLKESFEKILSEVQHEKDKRLKLRR